MDSTPIYIFMERLLLLHFGTQIVGLMIFTVEKINLKVLYTKKCDKFEKCLCVASVARMNQVAHKKCIQVSPSLSLYGMSYGLTHEHALSLIMCVTGQCLARD